MTSSWELRNAYGQDFDPLSPEEEAAEWAGEVGRDDGEMGGVSEEGMAALRGRFAVGNIEAITRGAYIEGYWEGFIERKYRSGAITLEQAEDCEPTNYRPMWESA